jgi:hypothetical protein
LVLLSGADQTSPSNVTEPIDIITDFEKGAERLPPEVAEELRNRQRAVADTRRRAQVNESLLTFRVRGLRGRLRRDRPASA